jgi:predicted nucleic acid-binding protein
LAFYFFDSSGLAKRYLQESGTGWVTSVTDPAVGNSILISEITQVEVVNALKKRERSGSLSFTEADLAINQFLLHVGLQYQVVSVHPSMIGRAIVLVRNYVLRAYDAVQLATALELSVVGRSTGASSLIFVSADASLNQAARSEGLQVEDPSQYPKS